MTEAATTGSGDDPLPAAPVLLGPEASSVVAVAVEFAGGRLRHLESRQVQYRAGHSLAVVYDARIQWPRDGVRTEGVVAMTSVDGPPEGALRVEADGLVIGVWRLAHDPLLPGLATVLSAAGTRRLLEQAVGPVSSSLRTYRPTRRAVVHLRGDRERWVKVVRPGRAAPLADLHHRFGVVVPAPAVAAVSDDEGLVCLEPAPGRPMLDAITGRHPLPDGGALIDLLARLAGADVAPATTRPTSRADAAGHARLVQVALPDQADRVQRILARLGDDAPVGSPVVVHGDFHEGQLLVGAGGEVSGVLDLDRAGVGEPADDLATMIAHLDALAIHRPELAGRARAYRETLWERFTEGRDPLDLAQRTVAVGLGLASGPFRMRQLKWEALTCRYLDALEHVLDRAGTRRGTR